MTTKTQEAANRERRQELEARVKREVCAVCGYDLLVANTPAGPALRCGNCNVYSPDTRPKHSAGLRQRYRRGEKLTAIELQTLALTLAAEIRNCEGAGELPKPLTVALLAKLEDEMNAQNAVAIRQETAVVTPEDAVRFLDFGKFTNADLMRREAIALVAETGLQPALGELIIYEGKLYVTVQGIGRLAGPVLDGIDPPKFWSREEKENAGYAPDDVVASVTVYRKGSARGMTGTGRANAAKPYRGNLVEKAFPQRMAENRALRHVYRMGFQDMLGRHDVALAPDEAQEAIDAGTFVDTTATVIATDAQGGVYIPTEHPEETTTETPDSPLVSDDGIAAIKGLQTAHRWDTATLLRHIKAEYGAGRLADLTEHQAHALADYLEMDGRPKN